MKNLPLKVEQLNKMNPPGFINPFTLIGHRIFLLEECRMLRKPVVRDSVTMKVEFLVMIHTNHYCSRHACLMTR